MKPILWILPLAVIFLCATLAPADDARIVSLYDVGRAAAPPVIDGKLDDACWQGRPVITDMVLRGAKTRIPAQVQTRTTVLYDDEALYIGMHLDEPNPAGLRQNITKVNGELWWDDSVEIYLETGCTHQRYLKFMSTPRGTRGSWEFIFLPYQRNQMEWGAGAEWTVAAFIGPDFWSLEFRLPFVDLGTAPPKPGDLWAFEPVRFRYADPSGKSEYSSWDVGAVYSAPQRFGNLVFAGATSELEKMMVNSLVPVYGGSMRILGRQGEIRYTDYPTLRANGVQSVTTALSEIKDRLEPIAMQMDPTALKDVEDKLSTIDQRLEELSQAQPGPATTESLDKLLAECRELTWTVRYQELLAALPTATKE